MIMAGLHIRTNFKCQELVTNTGILVKNEFLNLHKKIKEKDCEVWLFEDKIKILVISMRTIKVARKALRSTDDLINWIERKFDSYYKRELGL